MLHTIMHKCIIVCMKHESAISQALASAQRARAAGITQEEIATALSASQSQISRILAGKSVRRSKLMDAVCAYIDQHTVGITPEDVRRNDVLIDALASIWDGSTRQAENLALVIKSLHPLCIDRKGDERTIVSTGEER